MNENKVKWHKHLENKPVNHGVIVYIPQEEETIYFGSQRECAEYLEISDATVLKHLKDGKPDSKGRKYDYLT